MSEYQLVVTDPPHRAPEPLAIARLMRSTAADVRMKLNFPAPEIWFAETSEEAARDCTMGLRAAGLNVVWIPGLVLAAVPPASLVTEVSANESVVRIRTEDSDLQLSGWEPVVVVRCEPPEQDARPRSSGGSVLTQKVPGQGPVSNVPFVKGIATGVGGIAGYRAAQKLDKVAADAQSDAEKRVGGVQTQEPMKMYLDVYTYLDVGWRAARITPSSTDFSGLASLKQPTARGNFRAIIDLLRTRCRTVVDERLVKVLQRSSIVSGVALSNVLSTISTSLAAAPLSDISSRFAFLTSKGRIPTSETAPFSQIL